jgi:glycosyltransferase involved in cell wall biosynthesis
MVMAVTVSISVVICTYDNCASLDRVLEALSRQSVPPGVDWDVLVVDNNCTDDTRKVVARHADSRALPLRIVSELRQGLTPARLRGVVATRGDWIAFVDDDCLLEEDWVRGAAEFARAHPDCSAFGGMVALEWEREPSDVATRYGYAFAEQQHGSTPKELACLVGAGMVVRRRALQECGWIDHQLLEDRVGRRLVSGGDVEIALRLRARGSLWYAPGCRLLHVIPERRTSPGYLKAVNRGLGASKLLGDSMLWPGSYPRWLLVSASQSWEFARIALHNARGAARGGLQWADVAIAVSFLRGWWTGMWRLLRMPATERGALLGAAVAPRQG